MQGKVHYFLDGPLFEKILRILIIVIGGFAIPAVFLWFLSFLGAKDNPLASGTPFTLAQVMAIFGGFGLVAGFSDRVACDLRRPLRRMATLFLLSALHFCLMGMLLPALTVAEGGTASSYSPGWRDSSNHRSFSSILLLGGIDVGKPAWSADKHNEEMHRAERIIRHVAVGKSRVSTADDY